MSGNPFNTGGRTRLGTKILVHVYDLSPANSYLYPVGLGLHHSGVEVFGSEYSFASGAGIFDSPTPRNAGPGAVYRETYELGVYTGSMSDLRRELSDLKSEDFGPDDYHLLRRNCNHFANALVWKLIQKPIPAHINRLSEVGLCCSCLLPKQMLEQAPVGGTTSSSNGFQTFPPLGSQQNQRVKTKKAFEGVGMKLRSSSESGLTTKFLKSRSGSPRADDLTDRRERARKAAMARLEQQQKESDS